MAVANRQIHLAARPVGFPKETDFKLVEAEVAPIGEGEILVKTDFISVDPYMRGRMNEVRAYADPFEIDEVITGGSVGTVIESKNEKFSEGDGVVGMWGWQDYMKGKGSGLQKINPKLGQKSHWLGALGMPGMTAYFGLLSLCDPQQGETVFVSGAGGAVGGLVGQIAKIKGCKVVGSAGSDEKVSYIIEEYGFDAAFNYKTDRDYPSKLHELCPNGIDVYFDNVGGEMTDAVFMNLNTRARISICGAISQYNLEKPEMGPRLLTMLLIKQAKCEGFLVPQFMDRYPEGVQQMAQWIAEGNLKVREEITDGLENTPGAFIGMLKGQNRGKQLIKV